MLIYTLLRILTPEEINDLITTGSGHKRVSLSEIMLQEFEVNEGEGQALAKILPFKKKSDDEVASEEETICELSSEDDSTPPLELGPRCLKALMEFKKTHQLNMKDIFAAKRKTKKAKNTKETSLFIIEQKKKLEHASQSLKGKEIIQMYEKNAKVDVNIYRNNKDDLHKSNQFGVLVNKKQA